MDSSVIKVRATILGLGIAISMAMQTLADGLEKRQIFELQENLTELGYNVGTPDGIAGKRTSTALNLFFETQDEGFDGELNQEVADTIKAAVRQLRPTLNKPYLLLNKVGLKNNQCFERTLPFELPIDLQELKPVLGFNDSTSIGDSDLKTSSADWERKMVALSTLGYALGNEAYLSEAKSQLLKWARARAGSQTPINRTYGGAGNGRSYRANAPAPVLDMENAAQLAYSAVYVENLLADLLSEAEKQFVREWLTELISNFGDEIGVSEGRKSGIWRGLAAPASFAIYLNDEDEFQRQMLSAFSAIRQHVNDEGAILKNANRGDRALHYQSIGILGIASLIELAETQGIAIPADIEASYRKSVAFFFDADANPSKIAAYARQAYNNPGNGRNQVRYYRESAEHHWWMYHYAARYPGSENTKRIKEFLSAFSIFNLKKLALPTQWAPVAINCLYDIPLDGKQISGSEYATTFDFERVSVRNSYSDEKFEEFKVAFRNASIGGVRTVVPLFEVWVDFRSKNKSLNNIRDIRIAVRRRSLQHEDSRSASYLGCDSFIVQKDGGDELLKLPLVGETHLNQCALEKMSESDRIVWSSITQSLAGQIDTKGNLSKDAQTLAEFIRFASW